MAVLSVEIEIQADRPHDLCDLAEKILSETKSLATRGDFSIERGTFQWSVDDGVTGLVRREM